MPQPTLYWSYWLKNWFLPLLLLGIITNATGLFITILDSDGTLYATIAKTMVQQSDYTNLFVQGSDWLDKPHFPFWTTALSFQIFGINTFAYKFPAFLFWALGACYTFLLAGKLYDKYLAQIAVLIYIMSAHLIISNNDVRAEPYLTGLLVASVYHFYCSVSSNRIAHIAFGALFMAAAVMTKGIFIVIILFAGLFLHWAIKGKWSYIFHWQWLLAGVFILLGIVPELYCLYVQFDAHPEKIVFGNKGVSGIRFFFWDSQFGRFFNSGPIKGDGDIFFFIHTLLWAFLPWSLAFYSAIFWRLRFIAWFKHEQNKEYINLALATVGILLFSVSQFQLPHYTNILFPFFAIITAQYFYSAKQAFTSVFLQNTLTVVGVIMSLLVPCIVYALLPQKLWLYFGIGWLLLVAVGIYSFKNKSLPKSFGAVYIVASVVFIFLNTQFYPALLKYQSGSNAAAFANKQLTNQPIYLYDCNEYSLQFYTKAATKNIDSAAFTSIIAKEKNTWIFTQKEQISQLQKQGYLIKQQHAFEHFHASQLTLPFLNPATRKETLQYYYLCEVGKAQ
ncbi:MAG: ArnT family glycosyltransferase [Chitinophagaceae bacterium]